MLTIEQAKLHGQRIKGAVDDLNAAIDQASRLGLEVRLETETLARINGATCDRLEVTVSLPLVVGEMKVS